MNDNSNPVAVVARDLEKRVRGPEGPIDTIVVRSTLESRFGFATANSETMTWLHHPHGLIADHVRHTIDALRPAADRLVFVTTAETDKEAKSLLSELGVPFKKN